MHFIAYAQRQFTSWTAGSGCCCCISTRPLCDLVPMPAGHRAAYLYARRIGERLTSTFSACRQAGRSRRDNEVRGDAAAPWIKCCVRGTRTQYALQDRPVSVSFLCAAPKTASPTSRYSNQHHFADDARIRCRSNGAVLTHV